MSSGSGYYASVVAHVNYASLASMFKKPARRLGEEANKKSSGSMELKFLANVRDCGYFQLYYYRKTMLLCQTNAHSDKMDDWDKTIVRKGLRVSINISSSCIITVQITE